MRRQGFAAPGEGKSWDGVRPFGHSTREGDRERVSKRCVLGDRAGQNTLTINLAHNHDRPVSREPRAACFAAPHFVAVVRTQPTALFVCCLDDCVCVVGSEPTSGCLLWLDHLQGSSLHSCTVCYPDTIFIQLVVSGLVSRSCVLTLAPLTRHAPLG
jgi:hypothetical protein